MGWLTNIRMRLRALLHSEDVHREIAEEWQFHIDRRTEENVRRGLSPEEARKSAEQHFGNSGYLKDASWDQRGGGFFEILAQDLRYGARQLVRSPGFTFVPSSPWLWESAPMPLFLVWSVLACFAPYPSLILNESSPFTRASATILLIPNRCPIPITKTFAIATRFCRPWPFTALLP
jgi:hypothetical protein